MHTDGINAPLGEEAPGNLQDTSTMLRGVAPFGSISRYERLWQARWPWTATRSFHYVGIR